MRCIDVLGWGVSYVHPCMHRPDLRMRSVRGHVQCEQCGLSTLRMLA